MLAVCFGSYLDWTLSWDRRGMCKRWPDHLRGETESQGLQQAKGPTKSKPLIMVEGWWGKRALWYLSKGKAFHSCLLCTAKDGLVAELLLLLYSRPLRSLVVRCGVFVCMGMCGCRGNLHRWCLPSHSETGSPIDLEAHGSCKTS